MHIKSQRRLRNVHYCHQLTPIRNDPNYPRYQSAVGARHTIRVMNSQLRSHQNTLTHADNMDNTVVPR